MDAARRCLNTSHFSGRILPVGHELPKAENLLITNGKLLHFPLPKAENILKISQLHETPEKFRVFPFKKLITY
jgi:hypothetical protein